MKKVKTSINACQAAVFQLLPTKKPEIIAGVVHGDDGGYNAACYEVMMNMAMEKKDYDQARKDAANALRELPLVHQYAGIYRSDDLYTFTGSSSY